MGKMTVYHGSYTTIKRPQIIIGRNTKDFGSGFYCTIIREQADSRRTAASVKRRGFLVLFIVKFSLLNQFFYD